MSDQIPVAFEQKYARDFILLSQQKVSRLRNTVRDDPSGGGAKAYHFDRIGATEMQLKTSRHMDTPIVSTPHSRRRVTTNDYVWGDLIDRSDLQKMMKNPQSSYMTSGIRAAGRKIDTIIIAAANGNAVSVDQDDATSNVALPAAQKIAAGGTGLTLDKVLETKEKMDAAEVDEEDRFFIYTAKQATNMLKTTEVKSADYNTVQALSRGQIGANDIFLGFKWIRSERLAVDGASARLCLAYQKNAMGMYIPGDVYARISERADKNYSIQTFIDMSMGAVRIEDVGVVQVACVE